MKQITSDLVLDFIRAKISVNDLVVKSTMGPKNNRYRNKETHDGLVFKNNGRSGFLVSYKRGFGMYITRAWYSSENALDVLESSNCKLLMEITMPFYDIQGNKVDIRYDKNNDMQLFYRYENVPDIFKDMKVNLCKFGVKGVSLNEKVDEFLRAQSVAYELLIRYHAKYTGVWFDIALDLVHKVIFVLPNSSNGINYDIPILDANGVMFEPHEGDAMHLTRVDYESEVRLMKVAVSASKVNLY